MISHASHTARVLVALSLLVLQPALTLADCIHPMPHVHDVAPQPVLVPVNSDDTVIYWPLWFALGLLVRFVLQRKAQAAAIRVPTEAQAAVATQTVQLPAERPLHRRRNHSSRSSRPRIIQRWAQASSASMAPDDCVVAYRSCGHPSLVKER
jgi:hypothetical protein